VKILFQVDNAFYLTVETIQLLEENEPQNKVLPSIYELKSKCFQIKGKNGNQYFDEFKS
jgi:hypothetical protein